MSFEKMKRWRISHGFAADFFGSPEKQCIGHGLILTSTRPVSARPSPKNSQKHAAKPASSPTAKQPAAVVKIAASTSQCSMGSF